MKVLSVTYCLKKSKLRTCDERTLGVIQATMVFNVINEINVEMKKGKQQPCYHYRIKPVNVFIVNCGRKK